MNKGPGRPLPFLRLDATPDSRPGSVSSSRFPTSPRLTLSSDLPFGARDAQKNRSGMPEAKFPSLTPRGGGKGLSQSAPALGRDGAPPPPLPGPVCEEPPPSRGHNCYLLSSPPQTLRERGPLRPPRRPDTCKCTVDQSRSGYREDLTAHHGTARPEVRHSPARAGRSCGLAAAALGIRRLGVSGFLWSCGRGSQARLTAGKRGARSVCPAKRGFGGPRTPQPTSSEREGAGRGVRDA